MVFVNTNVIPGASVGPDPTIPLAPINSSLTATNVPTTSLTITAMCMPSHNMTSVGTVSIGGACGPHMKCMGSTALMLGWVPAARMTDFKMSDVISPHSPNSPTQIKLMALR